jgi:surface polysaccharide O-acyltransferase-like enzyme
MKLKLKERIEWIDLLRALAILSIVLCHSIEGIYTLNLDYMSKIQFKSQIFAFIVFTFGRLGVPLFMMISGYLLLDKTYDSVRCRHFWKNNWFHLLVCTEIWWIIYDLFLYEFEGQEFDLKQVVEELFFVRKVNMIHVWYMPMILGMYLLFPLVANALKMIDINILKLPVIFFSYIHSVIHF